LLGVLQEVLHAVISLLLGLIKCHHEGVDTADHLPDEDPAQHTREKLVARLEEVPRENVTKAIYSELKLAQKLVTKH